MRQDRRRLNIHDCPADRIASRVVQAAKRNRIAVAVLDDGAVVVWPVVKGYGAKFMTPEWFVGVYGAKATKRQIAEDIEHAWALRQSNEA